MELSTSLGTGSGSRGKSIPVRSYVTSVTFNFVGSPSDVGSSVSIRSESTQLPSEQMSVAVKIAGKDST